MAEANLRDQSLKSQAALGGRAGTPKIIVNDDDLLLHPAKLRGPIHQRILQPRRLLMTLNLLERGLADIYNRQAFLMSPDNLLANRPDPVSRETRVRHA